MRLSAIPLINWQSVNSYCSANQWIIRNGEQHTLYFELIDLDQQCSPSLSGQGMCPQPYIAGVGSQNQPDSLVVTFPSIDCENVIKVTAVQNPNNGAIWSVNLSATQRPSGGGVQFTLTEGNTIRNFYVLNMLGVEYPFSEGCDCSIPDSGTFDYTPSGEGV